MSVTDRAAHAPRQPQAWLIYNVGQKMEYTDPHHKRTEFTAESFSSDVDGASRRIAFVGSGQHDSVVLLERGSTVVAIVPEEKGDFVLWKAQILEKSKWLALDFEDNPLLRRILVHIDRLDANRLDDALKSLIGSRSLLYYRRHV